MRVSRSFLYEKFRIFPFSAYHVTQLSNLNVAQQIADNPDLLRRLQNGTVR